MTREEKIEILEKEKAYMIAHGGDRQAEALTSAIKALEQEPCEDAIRRQAVLETLDDMDNALDEDRTVENYKELLKECYEVLPPVNPQEPNCKDCDYKEWLKDEIEPKTGHWIDIMVGDMPAQACDRCNTFYPLAYTGGGHKYCPNCGARMESEG